MTEERTPPLCYHIIRVPDELLYCVDADTAREVWDWITEWHDEAADYLDITTLDGASVTLIRGKIISIEETSPEIRRFNRLHRRMMEEEHKEQGFLD